MLMTTGSTLMRNVTDRGSEAAKSCSSVHGLPSCATETSHSKGTPSRRAGDEETSQWLMLPVNIVRRARIRFKRNFSQYIPSFPCA